MNKLICIIVLFIASCTAKIDKYERGVVLSHNVTADEYGSRRYATVIRLQDGLVIERMGLKFYSKAVGDTVTVVLNNF